MTRQLRSQIRIDGLQRGDDGLGGSQWEMVLLIHILGWNGAHLDKEVEQQGNLKHYHGEITQTNDSSVRNTGVIDKVHTMQLS